MVNNLDWTAELSAIDLLRDVGRHFRVNKMIAKDVVATRLASDAGISYTEFSYQVLQSLDFLELYRRHGCVLQTGGSDQWGNLTAGLDLVHRAEGASVHALATPLVTKADGTKFGKTETGTVWLDPEPDLAVRVLPVLGERGRRDVAHLSARSSACDPARRSRSSPRPASTARRPRGAASARRGAHHAGARRRSRHGPPCWRPRRCSDRGTSASVEPATLEAAMLETPHIRLEDGADPDVHRPAGRHRPGRQQGRRPSSRGRGRGVRQQRPHRRRRGDARDRGLRPRAMARPASRKADRSRGRGLGQPPLGC